MKSIRAAAIVAALFASTSTHALGERLIAPASCELKDARQTAGVGGTQAANTWAPACAPLSPGVARHTVTPLGFGQTLIAGGYIYTDYGGFYGVDKMASPEAQIYDEHTGQFLTTTGGLHQARWDHTATRLADGKVLIIGGDADLPNCLACSLAPVTTEIYAPVTQTFSHGPAPVYGRMSGHSAILLADGRVLLTGGICFSICPDPSRAAELYDPATQQFSVTGNMTVSRRYHTSTLLNDGRVLITGGVNDAGIASNTAEIFNPATGIFTAVAAPMNSGHSGHAAVRMADGRVILGGGNSTAVEIFNPATGQFPSAGSLSFTTNEPPAAALLPSGKVVFVHDFYAEVFDPVANAFTSGAYAYANSNSFDFPEGGSGALLKNGLFLWTGGVTGSYPPAASADAYLYRPPN